MLPCGLEVFRWSEVCIDVQRSPGEVVDHVGETLLRAVGKNIVHEVLLAPSSSEPLVLVSMQSPVLGGMGGMSWGRYGGQWRRSCIRFQTIGAEVSNVVAGILSGILGGMLWNFCHSVHKG
jgi:hypothetical protein